MNTDIITHRGNWGRQLDFILSCVGYAVGLGNLWRFPYLCMRNGGGAFLIPYFIFLFLCGMPLYFMELVIGQYASLSPMCVWKMCPLFKGIGYGMVLVSGVVCIYYNVILAWGLYYMVMSFTTGDLPWATCGHWWNTPLCLERTLTNNASFGANETINSEVTMSMANETVNSEVTMSMVGASNTSNLTGVLEMMNSSVKRVTPAEEFWKHNVLQITGGVNQLGPLRWELVLCLLGAWVLVFACLCKGVKSSGKVVYVTALAPYVFIFIFLVQGLQLNGASDGIWFFLTPDWKRLLEFRVWGEACSQIFYSLGPAYGGLITMASYNKFSHNCYRDAVLIPCINCGTSFIAGLVIFSVIGHMAKTTGLSVGKVITSGPGLAFVAYPEAMTTLPVSPMWAILFFLMLIIIGLDTQFGMFETMISGFVDEFPHHLKDRKVLFTAATCVLEFIIGLPMVTRGGIYIFQILDWYSATFSLIAIATLECIVVCWIYGVNRLYRDIEQMLGKQPTIWWKICLSVITPFLLLTVLISTFATFASPTFGDYHYPTWAIVFGWFVGLVSLMPIPGLMAYQLIITPGSFKQRIKFLCQPDKDWGPAQVASIREKVASLIEKSKPDIEEDQEEVEPGTQKVPLVDLQSSPVVPV